jgi:hypothetical protein
MEAVCHDCNNFEERTSECEFAKEKTPPAMLRELEWCNLIHRNFGNIYTKFIDKLAAEIGRSRNQGTARDASHWHEK